MLALHNRLATVLLILVALTACNQIAGSNPNIRPSQTTNEVTQSNLNLAVEYIRQRDYEKALEKLDKAKEADPAYSVTYNVYGLLYQQIGQFDKAEKNFKRAISLNRNDSSTLNNYGRFLCQQERIEEAEETFLKAAKNPLYESPEIAITNAGLCLDNNGQKQQAVDYYRQALQLNPQMPQALLKMCEVALNENNHLSGRGYLQRYQQVARHTPKSLWLGIQIENELGDKDAVSSYALLLRNSFPDSREAGLLSRSGIK